MKVLKIHIENIRGIKEIDLAPEGKNFVVFGPNGTGKSAIVDALDFLFTGRISRLSGEGTGGITVKSHGPHVDSKPEDTVVEADIQIPNSKDVVRLKRSLSKPDEIEVLSKDKVKLSEILDVASRGQHVLSRREILRYITAKKGERSKEIQALLNLKKIEQLRELFVSVETESQRKYESSKIQLMSSLQSFGTKLGLDQFSEASALKRINEYRKVLKGEAIKVFDKGKIKENLNPPAEPYKITKINPTLIKDEIATSIKIIKEESKRVPDLEQVLVEELKKLKLDEDLQKEIKSLTLLQYGISLLDETGKCPLCETQWDPAELKAKLEMRLTTAKQAKALQDRIKNSALFLREKYSSLKDRLTEISKSLEILELPEIKKVFDIWIADIESYLKDLSDPANNLEKIVLWLSAPPMFSLSRFEDKFKNIEQKLTEEEKKYSPEQIAWDTLTRLEVAMEAHAKAEEEYKKDEKLFARASLLRSNYERSRDKILNKLYKDIETDFVTFYKLLHGDDEKTFGATLESKGPELNLEVDFYGRGRFPPIAYHSEGHQDSMGLCLYLALMKLLTEGKVLLTILDDVVMSIDSGHRRAFSKLLKSEFKERQFLITTHNRTWARQLQTDGIVEKKNMIEFRKWSVDTGPIFEIESDSWKQIYTGIEDNHISDAAAKLREFSEFYFDEVCGSLQARTIHKLDGQYELGDLLPAAIKQYKSLLNRAKSSANSWDNKEDVEKLSQIESIAQEVIARSQVEQWGINPAVHYSRWADFSKDDFLPIAEAFQNLTELFRCNKCKGILFIASIDKVESNLRCGCSEVNWNLVKKK